MGANKKITLFLLQRTNTNGLEIIGAYYFEISFKKRC